MTKDECTFSNTTLTYIKMTIGTGTNMHIDDRKEVHKIYVMISALMHVPKI
jgi:hypothetical protein